MGQTESYDQASRWDKFAEVDACKYIMTELPSGSPEMFWESGRTAVSEELLPLIQRYNVPLNTCLEIGCGVGRLLLPLSSSFRRAIGLDISEGMIRRAHQFAKEREIANADFIGVANREILSRFAADNARQVSFVYSLLVLQHIPDFQTIESYVAATAAMLDKDGIGYLHFDTRAASTSYRIKTALPDVFLPRFWRRSVRRIRRTPTEIAIALEQNGLRVIEEIKPHSADHRYVIRLADR